MTGSDEGAGGFRVAIASMKQACPRLDQVTRVLSGSCGDAAVPVGDGAFGQLAESTALHAAFRQCTELVTQNLDDLAGGIASMSRGVATAASNYQTLDDSGAERLAALAASLA